MNNLSNIKELLLMMEACNHKKDNLIKCHVQDCKRTPVKFYKTVRSNPTLYVGFCDKHKYMSPVDIFASFKPASFNEIVIHEIIDA